MEVAYGGRKLKNINDSIVADHNSQIKKASISKNNEIHEIKKKSFWKGFLAGILSSLVGSIIFYYLKNILE